MVGTGTMGGVSEAMMCDVSDCFNERMRRQKQKAEAERISVWPGNLEIKIMLIRIIMPFLLSQLPTLLTFAKGPSRTSTFISGIKSLRSVCRGGSSSSVAEGDESSPSSAYFPIYFNDGYEVNLPKGHRFPMEKYRKVRAALQDKIMNIDEKEKKVDCGKLTDRENRNIGFPWSQQHVNRSLSSVGGTLHAALSAWEEYVRRKSIQQRDGDTSKDHIQKAPLCWGAHVAGGTHHAFSDYGEGFCIFSDIAVAANVLLQTYGIQSQQSKVNPIATIRRILIIDLDVHQGNGNAVLFKENDRVKTFSMHCVGNYFSEKQNSDLDVELPIGCDDETYISTLKYWLTRIEKHRFDKEEEVYSKKQFDVIFYQAGVDIHHADRLGKLSITQEGWARLLLSPWEEAIQKMTGLQL
eukprot:scaffold152942_cov54-Cyclotella_meneghiniana.AAC.2